MEDVAVPEESAEETAGEALEVSEEAPALMAGEESLEAGDSTEWTSGWNENKTQYKNDAGEIQTGLFKGRKKNGSEEYALFHADSAGTVEKRVGVVTVTGLEKGKYYSFNGRAFDYDPDLEGTVKYFQKYDSTFDCYCMDETAGLKDCAEGRCYLTDKGIVRTEAGILDLSEGKFYVQDGGMFYTTPGWLDVSGTRYFLPANDGKIAVDAGFFSYDSKTWLRYSGGAVNTAGNTLVSANGARYYTNADGSVVTAAGQVINYQGKKYVTGSGGAISTATGVVQLGGSKYLALSDGSICTTPGFVSAGGRLYYVTNYDGVLAENRSFKIGKKTYHAMSDGSIAVGAHYWGKKYYFSDGDGALHMKAGVVSHAGNYYHVSKKAIITKNKKVKYKKKYYIASKNGVIYKGLFTWKKNLYYASDKGVLRTKSGSFLYNGSRYFSRKGGKIYKNKLFSSGGKKYLANKDGTLAAGFFKWKGKYYLTNEKCAIYTKAAMYTYGHKQYYAEKGGVIAVNKFITYKDKYYYAGSDGAIVKKSFKYKGITIRPNSSTGVISMEDYVKVFPEAAPKEVNG